ncbi:MAG: hypothetical protein P8179_18240 [Candidatus Thiodiazotropha sp.]
MLDSPVTEAHLDADNGLPLPNLSAIEAFPVNTTPGQHTLLGRELTIEAAIALLESAPQSIRAVAAHHLVLTLPQAVLSIRASAAAQRQQITTLRAMVQLI